MDPTKFLDYFGYLANRTMAGAVGEFQSRYGLPVSGEFDDRTERAMLAPRCGMPDHPMMAMDARWLRRDLSYFVASYVNGLSKADQDDLIQIAFDQWHAVANINFSRAASAAQANIIIATGSSRSDGFDGAMGVLAWAQLPQGDDSQLMMRFDLSETWIRNATDRGILFLNVACHEFGHLLGLDHSSQRNALMAPYYSAGISKPQAVDDIPRIQSLYGPPVVTVPPVTPTPGAGSGAKVVITGTVDSLVVDGWRCSKLAG